MPLIHPLIHDWNADAPPAGPAVMLDDETLRDGLQSPSVRCPDIDEKLREKSIEVRLDSFLDLGRKTHAATPSLRMAAISSFV